MMLNRAQRKPATNLASADIGAHNFKERFDADILEYVNEDLRLSTLQRKLVRENNSLVSHALACQITDVMFYSDNRAYVFRSYEVICDACFEILHSGKHGDKVKKETAKAIGRVGYVLATWNDGDFDTFWKFYKKMWDKFREGAGSRSKEKDLIYCIKAFQFFLETKPHVVDFVANALLEDLQDTLEKTENYFLVPTLVTCLAYISEQQPKLFEPRFQSTYYRCNCGMHFCSMKITFQDIVDILVGWHVDVGQSPSLKMHISSVLLSWHSFWIIDLEFSAGLLRQFMEDIESFTEDVEENSDDLNECIEKIASVVQVFNTVLSCLRSKSTRQRTTVSFLPSESTKWAEVLLHCLLTTLNKRFDEDILIAGQQSLLMLLERIESLFRDNEPEMIQFYKLSMKSMKKLSYKGQALNLEFAVKMMSFVKQQQQQELVTIALDQQLVKQAATSNGHIGRKAISRFLREMLKSKNILVLQEAYAAVVNPLKSAVGKLSQKHQNGLRGMDVKIVLFALECLTDLINAKGSVLSMWALDPPLFTLLSDQVQSQHFAQFHPEAHGALLKMLIKHSSVHHHFLASSQLLTSTLTSLAPTADYFQKLLATIRKLLSYSDAKNEALIGWIVDVLTTTEKSFAELQQNSEFAEFCKDALATEAASILSTFLQLDNKNNLALSLVLKKVNSNDPEERHKAIKMLEKLPPLSPDWIQKQPENGGKSNEIIKLRSCDFKSLSDILMIQILEPNNVQEKELWHLLESLNVTAFEDTGSQVQWCGDVIAAYCIANKLKTTFGKAQDTLGAYEKTMRTLANNFGASKEFTTSRIRQARNFLIVFDCLEKAMLNAWDGNNLSAFFVANRKTCLDWLSRLRVMTAHVAFHVGEFAFALRQSLKALERSTDNVDEDLLAIAAFSMKNLDSTGDNISGLYTWANESFNKKFRWMKGLIGMAKGRREEGLESIKSNLKATSGLCHKLLCQELLAGHFSLNDFASYDKWLSDYKEQNQTTNFNFGKSLEALCTFPGNYDQLGGVSDGPKNIEEIFLCAQHQLLRSANSKGGLDGIDRTLLGGLVEDVALTDSQWKRALIIANVQSMLTTSSGADIDTFLTYRERTHSTEPLLLIKKWGDYFLRFVAQKPHLHFKLNALNLEIAIQARKERNFRLATKHLEQNLDCDNLMGYINGINFNSLNLFLSTDKANCLRQCAKLAYVTGAEHQMTAVQVTCGIGVVGLRCPTDNQDLNTIAAKSFNTMAKWLKRNPQLMDPDVVSSTIQDSVNLTQILAHQPVSMDVSDDDSSLLVTDAPSDGDMVIGRLLKLATVMAPNLAKIWYEFANWSLEMGEKMLASAINGQIALTTLEECKLAELGLPKDKLQHLTDIVSHIHLKPIELEADKNDCMRKILSTELVIEDEEIATQILAVWQQIQKRIFYYQEVATKSYFTFMTFSKQKEQKVISATLRLLQLIVKHSFELQESLQEGLDKTPSQCWLAIIPQLFSRLNHPVKVVRNRISDLLCRIADDHSSLIIYPAIVGSMANETVKVFEDLNHDGDGNEAVKDPEEMQSAHEKIVHHLINKDDHDKVEHVKVFVAELQRISILWDELWFGTIQQYTPEVTKRVKKMEDEAKKLDKNPTLTAEEKRALVKDKYYILFKPILYVFNKVEMITKRAPETPIEANFASNYGQMIEEMMTGLREPVDYAKPRQVWKTLTELQAKIQARRGQLQLCEISPALSKLNKTLIPMPGQDLTIDNLEPLLSILPTKTKPKKIKVRANNGKLYSYLFKGLEDLHLDERIMQFLSIANTLMKNSNFKARHYSVVPLGPRSGLIQWVEGAVPMFSLYKKWHQKRQNVLEMASKKDRDASKQIPQKPVDQYYNKLIPLLRDHGIHNLDNRKEWPLSVMRQVLFELMEETPKDLLSSSLYLSAKTSNEWHSLTANLTRSIAVMSVIGYIIGLGDRHLDNLLIDFKNGEVIHIDYNVCFEKGAKLRIPERVPFRLTQNIVNIFGITGVEGLFRLSCERTLEILRGGKETLLTLLEAFIYDPLVDWTPGVELGLAHGTFGRNADNVGQELNQDKRDMQAEITFSMLSVRMAEMKSSWMNNKSNLTDNLTSIEDVLSCWTEENNGLGLLRDALNRLHKAISILKEAESNPSHKLYALQDRYTEHCAVETAVETSRNKIAAFIEEHEKLSSIFQRVMNNITTHGQLTKWSNEVSMMNLNKWTSETVADFLKSAGQVHLLEQVEQMEASLRIGLDKIKASLHLGLQLLGHCTTMTSMYPQGYKDEHRVCLYLKWMKQLNDQFDVDTCQSVVNDFNEKFVEKNSEVVRLKQHQIMNLNYQLETSAQDIHFRLQNIFKRMMTHGIDNSKAVIEAGLSLQSEASAYIKSHPGLCQSLCLDQLLMSKQKLLHLESLIIDDSIQFAVQTNGDTVLLDELFTEVGYCGEICGLMDEFNLINSSMSQKIQSFINAHKQFKNLIGSYFAIILQEGLKNCQKDDGAMEQAAKKIDEIIDRKDSDKYISWIQELNANSGTLTSGQMIVMAMNSLLDNIDNELEAPVKDMSARLTCISEFFHICFRAMNSFKADDVGQLFPNGDEMGFPIIKYMANYYLQHFQGNVVSILSTIIGDENEDLMDVIKQRTIEARDKGQFLTLELNAIFANLRKKQLALNLEFKVEILNANQQINQLQRNSFQWFHQDSLPMQVITAVQPLRPQVLHDLQNCIGSLLTGQKELMEINTKYQELNATVEQRLKWACGANPDLQQVFDNFSSAFAAEMEAVKSLMTTSKAFAASANTIMHHENLRTTSRDALSADSSVMSLFAECQQSVQLQESQAQSQELGSLELNIFRLNPPEDLIDKTWIQATSDLVADQVRNINKEIQEEKEKMKGTQQSLQSRITDFKKTLTTHQKLMADVGSLLRSIDKTEELEVPEVTNYLRTYRDFTDKVALMLKKLSDDLTDEKVSDAMADIEAVKDICPAIFDNLATLASNLKDENIEQFKKADRGQVEHVDQQSNNAEEKNAFALSVLRRIKTKLDGREPDVLRKSSVSEQVDFIIREAMNVDNLALLYEGWTAWI